MIHLKISSTMDKVKLFASSIMLSLLFLLSCDKTMVNPPMILDDETAMQMDDSESVLLQGDFMAGAHPTSGVAKIIDQNGVRKLKFINFKTDSGPDLRVYLAENQNAKNYIQVSKKVENGNLIYEIPTEANLEKQTHVLIWCKLFKVNFGSAELKMP